MSLTFPLQALLARHEQFLLDAEDERKRMSGSIDRLEQERESLKASNAQMIEENRHLLDQLEDMNQTISSGEERIKSLVATLESSKQENMRLVALATKAVDLETQLSVLETEQFAWREQLTAKEEDERTAIQRWRTAERTIMNLQDQVDKIEREAIEERARHGEVMARLERRNTVERELENAAGRLKGAAAVTRLESHRISDGVVSHFVKDILQDNSNLQMGIVELKEMLSGSNAEVQKLREQMMVHQALPSAIPDEEVTTPSLAEELAEPPTREILSELHVHHHYHAPAKPRSTSVRGPKKRRNATSPGSQTPLSSVSGFSTPRRCRGSLPPVSTSPSAAILSQTVVSIPPSTSQLGASPITSPRRRLSFAPSSVPSTPQSAFRTMFDNIDSALDSSRPTSPESVASEVPSFGRQRRQGLALSRGEYVSDVEHCASAVLGVSPSRQTPSSSGASFPREFPVDTSTILEEEDEDTCFSAHRCSKPTLHRSTSHESILSIKDPPPASRGSDRLQRSQILGNPAALRSRASVAPITTSETAVAQRAVSSSDRRGQDLLAKAANGVNDLAAKSIDKSANNKYGQTDTARSNGSQGITSRLNGWFIGKWGMTPTHQSTSDLRAKAVLGAQLQKDRTASAATAASTISSASPQPKKRALVSPPPLPPPTSQPQKLQPKLRHRTTGINQPGAIMGLIASIPKTPVEVVVEPKEVDLSALRESLGEG